MKIILCEGITEVALVYYLNKEINNSWSSRKFNDAKGKPYIINDEIVIFNIDGKDNLKKATQKLAKFLAGKEVSEIGFIMDADDNYDAMASNIDDKIDKLKDSGIEANYSYYILPHNDGSKGMAEDLVMNGLKSQELLNLINTQVYPLLKEHPESNIKNEAKTKFMLFGATQNPHTASPTFMLMRAQELIDLDSDIFTGLKKYVEEIIIDKEEGLHE